MENDSTINFSENYKKFSHFEPNRCERKIKLIWCLSFFVLAVFVVQSAISVCYLKKEVEILQKKMFLLELRAEVELQLLKNLQSLFYAQLQEVKNSLDGKALLLNNEESNLLENHELPSNEQIGNDELPSVEESNFMETNETPKEDDSEESIDEANMGFKRKREIRDYNESFPEKHIKTETENKSTAQKSSMESSSSEKSSETLSKETFFTTNTVYASSTRKPHSHRKHRKSRIGSAERFFTETHSTTSTPIQVRQSRTKVTQGGVEKALWLQNQKLQQHTSPHKDTITKEEALRKGYAKHSAADVSYELDASKERGPDALSYNMIMIHFSADTSHYSRERDPHYFGNGRMQIKSEVYKDWKPAHWTQGVGMSKYFHLHQGRVTVSTTGIYLIYAQIQYSNVQEVNGFSVFRNKEVVVQCITTSTHPDKHEIKSNTCGISTTILLQSNDSVCIKDLHHGRYVVLTPEKSYFGLVLLSPFKN